MKEVTAKRKSLFEAKLKQLPTLLSPQINQDMRYI
jgi:hypothetical protein